jgi:hypothetical protein
MMAENDNDDLTVEPSCGCVFCDIGARHPLGVACQLVPNDNGDGQGVTRVASKVDPEKRAKGIAYLREIQAKRAAKDAGEDWRE